MFLGFALGVAATAVGYELRSPPIDAPMDALRTERTHERSHATPAGGTMVSADTAIAPTTTASTPVARAETPKERIESRGTEKRPRDTSATLDILEPRGGRVRIDGEWLARPIPIRGLSIAPGRHRVRVVGGSIRKNYVIDAAGGDHFEVAREVRRADARARSR